MQSDECQMQVDRQTTKSSAIQLILKNNQETRDANYVAVETKRDDTGQVRDPNINTEPIPINQLTFSNSHLIIQAALQLIGPK